MNATELIRAYYDAFNAGDMAAFLDLLDENIEHDVNQGSRQSGKEAFQSFMDRMNRCYRERLTGITVMSSADGTRAAAEFVVHGEYLATDEGLPVATGQKYELPAGAFFEIRNSKITRVTNYYNLETWIAQVAGSDRSR